MTVNLSSTRSNLLQKFGFAGFAFFFIKGILWLIAPFVFVWFY